MSIAHLLNESVTQYRETETDDGAGGHRRAFAALGPLAVRLPQPSTTERFDAEQGQAEHTQIVYTLAGADVRKGDRLTHADGRTWRVTATVRPSKPKYLRLDCELRELEGGVSR